MHIIENIREAHRRRQAARDLRALSPDVLRDIGIEPDRIDAAVSQMLAAKPAVRTAASALPAALHAKTAVIAGGAWPYTWRR